MSQEKALRHAFKLPSLKRLVYSTCSSHSIEGEEVIQKVLPLANQLGFQLEVRFLLRWHWWWGKALRVSSSIAEN